MATRVAKKKVVKKSRANALDPTNGANRVSTPKGRRTGDDGKSDVQIHIPTLMKGVCTIRIYGDKLMVNNKLGVAQALSDRYSGAGSTASPKDSTPVSDDEAYARAFYVFEGSKHPAGHPKGDYGVPTGGIKACINAGCRPAGFKDNTEIGTIQKAFKIRSDGNGLCRIHFKKLERDVRMVNIGRVKTVPQMRHRPLFRDWYIDLEIEFNPKILGVTQLVNLAAHAGMYIGLCELRAQKGQGECGSFDVTTPDKQ